MKLPAQRLLALLAACTLSLLVACSGDKKAQDMTEQELYDAAQENLDNNSFSLAVKNLQLLEARYPFGPYAEQAQLEIIYAHYRSYEPEAAIASADRFIRLHPNHPNVDYAYYMKGMANYSDAEGFLNRFLPRDITTRDPGRAIQSFEDFRQLTYRYPASAYAPDANARMIFLRERLARYEIEVANYYFRRGAFLAAADRGRYVVENYAQTQAVADGLAVMIQAYRLLDMKELAQNAEAVLRTNYPQHPSLDENGAFIDQFELAEGERTWINILTLGLFDHPPTPQFDNRAEFLRP